VKPARSGRSFQREESWTQHEKEEQSNPPRDVSLLVLYLTLSPTYNCPSPKEKQHEDQRH
jgi:hypothetical protein